MSAADRLRAAVREVAKADDPDARAAAWARYAADGWLADLGDLSADPDALAILAALRAIPGLGKTADTYARVLRERAAKAPTLRIVRPDEDPGTLAQQMRRLGLEGCPDGVAMPDGYRLGREGVIRDTEEGPVVIAHGPILVVGTGEDGATGQRYVRLAWRTPGAGWVERSVDRAIVAQARRITDLAEAGAPVTSVSASAIVAYLAAQEAASAGRLPACRVVRCPGWYDDASLYLLGSDAIPTQGPDGWVLEPTSAGDAQWYAHIRRAGRWTDWLRAWDAVQPHPRAALAVYAAICPMLRGVIAEIPGAAVEWAGRTSGGKSITLELAASVWGSPELIRRWDTTAVGAEVAAVAARDMPLLLDDTKALLSGGSERRKEAGASTITATIYLATGAKGRARGAKDGGSRRTSDVRTWLLSTAETPSVDLAQDVGIRPRTLTVTGRPLGDDSEAGETAAAIVSSVVRAHHGHLAMRCAAWLCDPAHQEEARSRYREHLERAAQGDPVRRRLAQLVASIQTAIDVCAGAGLAPCWGAVDAVVEAAEYSLRAAQTHRAALQALWGAASAQGRILGLTQEHPRVPPGGWIGEERVDGTVSLVEAQARRELRILGYDLSEVVDQWRAEGWLVIGKSGASRVTVTVGGYRTTGYRLAAPGVAAAQGSEVSDG